jgi:hypothetical protein
MTVEEDTQEQEAPEDVADEEPKGKGEDPEPDEDDSDEPKEKLLSQQEVDRILQKRLKRQEDQLLKKFGDYDTLKTDAENFRKLQDEKATDAERWEREKAQMMASLAEKDEKLTKLERSTLIADLATERGLPKSFWKRVSGESEEDIAEDIDSIIHDLDLGKKSKDEDGKDETPKKKPAPKKVYGGGGENEDPEPDIDKIIADIPRGPQPRK